MTRKIILLAILGLMGAGKVHMIEYTTELYNRKHRVVQPRDKKKPDDPA